jgi:carbonic anhydrase
MPKSIENLIQGYKNFRKEYFEKDKHFFEQLTKIGQQPKVLMIACSDSRVDPAIVTGAAPGDLFVVRNVANLVPPYEPDSSTYHGTSAALEFGVCGLNIRHIIVFGHSQCGGINSLFHENADASSQKSSFINKWMGLANIAFNKVTRDYGDRDINAQIGICAQYSLINSLENLQTFPWIRQRVQAKELFLHAWYFDMSDGSIKYFNDQGQFAGL